MQWCQRAAMSRSPPGDTAGQGWGIDDDGMRTYATMAQYKPDFFIHSGDTVYADGPMQDEVEKDGKLIWKNTTLIDEKRKVAETLDEFRAQGLDDHARDDAISGHWVTIAHFHRGCSDDHIFALQRRWIEFAALNRDETMAWDGPGIDRIVDRKTSIRGTRFLGKEC